MTDTPTPDAEPTDPQPPDVFMVRCKLTASTVGELAERLADLAEQLEAVPEGTTSWGAFVDTPTSTTSGSLSYGPVIAT